MALGEHPKVAKSPKPVLSGVQVPKYLRLTVVFLVWLWALLWMALPCYLGPPRGKHIMYIFITDLD